MREIIARVVCLLTVAVVMALAHVFAQRHNPRGSAPVPVAPAAESVRSSDAVRGREVSTAQGCSSCHAIAGVGNPRNPLDGVGSRRYNQSLSEARARAVIDVLHAGGVARDRLHSRAYGKDRPLEPNRTAAGDDNPDGRARNRRVALVIETR